MSASFEMILIMRKMGPISQYPAWLAFNRTAADIAAIGSREDGTKVAVIVMIRESENSVSDSNVVICTMRLPNQKQYLHGFFFIR